MTDPTSENSPMLSSTQRLVAYLDGELDAAEQARIEDQLAVDRDLRNQLLGLQQTWDCLDELPATHVDEKFTQTTMAMATVAASQELSEIENQAASRRTVRGIAMTGALAASLLLGLLLAAAIWPDPNGQLLDDLPLLVRFDAYQSLEDVDFLRELERQQFFPPPAEIPTDDSALNALPVSTAARETQAWIEGLLPDEKNRLAEQQRRFQALSGDQQQRIRTVAREIADDPQADQLLATLDRYHDWLITLTPGQRADLAGYAPDERIAEMRALQRGLQRDASERQRSISENIRPLNLADVEKITDWMRRFLAAHVAENRDHYVQKLPSIMRDEFDAKPRDQQNEILLAMAWRGFMMSERIDHANVPEAEIRQLVESLSPAVQEEFRLAKTNEQRKRLLVGWMRKSLFVRWTSGSRGGQFNRVTEAELEDHFVDDLTSDERAKLLVLHPDKMRDRLRESYLSQESRPGQPPRHFGPPPGGNPDRRPGRGSFRRPGPGPKGPGADPRHERNAD